MVEVSISEQTDLNYCVDSTVSDQQEQRNHSERRVCYRVHRSFRKALEEGKQDQDARGMPSLLFNNYISGLPM